MKRNRLGRRLAALAAAAAMLLSTAGCGKKENDAPAQTEQTISQAETSAPVKVTLPPKTTVSQADTGEGADEKKPMIGEDIPNTPAVWKATSPEGRSHLSVRMM